MAYVLEALVAQPHLLQPHCNRYRNARVVPLERGWAMIPLTSAVLDEMHAGNLRANHDPFRYPLSGQDASDSPTMSPAIVAWAEEMSRGGRIAYVAEELFGGSGDLAAMVWEHGRVIFGPEVKEWLPHQATHDSLLNRALRILGVGRDNSIDEFAALGLDARRDTDEW